LFGKWIPSLPLPPDHPGCAPLRAALGSGGTWWRGGRGV
jgi:hypothetical protein